MALPLQRHADASPRAAAPAATGTHDVLAGLPAGRGWPAGPLAPAGEVGVQTIPGGRCATFPHFGPYKTLRTTYARLFGRWLARRAAGRSPS